MNKELKNKWVEVLRSGKYKQAKKNLHSIRDNEHSYCCLGVLCRVAGIKTHKGLRYFRNTSGGFLHEKLLYKFGFNDEQQRILADMNDDGKSFKEIADYIEENL